MLGSAVSAVRFLWGASAGYRFRPWQSPYLRWRMETYSGQPAGSLRAADFLRLAWTERRQVGRFIVWLGTMERLARGEKP